MQYELTETKDEKIRNAIKENQEKVIHRLKLMNLSTQQIAKAVELEIKEVEKILNEKQ